MSKERTSLSLESDVAQYLKQDHINASGLVEQLLKQHMTGGASDEAIRKFRIQQLESEIEEIEGRREQKEEQLENLREIAEEKAAEQSAELAEAREVLADVPKEPTNPAIENWASDLGMTPQELIDELEGGGE